MLPPNLLSAAPIQAALIEIMALHSTVTDLGISRDSAHLLGRAETILRTHIETARTVETRITVEQYAAVVGLTPAAVRYRIRTGKLDAIRYGKRWRVPLPKGGVE